MPNPHTHTALALGLLWLALAPLAGCQQHTGDDWYCITLPNHAIPDHPLDTSDPGIHTFLAGRLPTGHLPLHDKDKHNILLAMQNYWWQDGGTKLDFRRYDEPVFDHLAPGKVRVFLTPQERRDWLWYFYIYHTGDGWKVVARWGGCE